MSCNCTGNCMRYGSCGGPVSMICYPRAWNSTSALPVMIYPFGVPQQWTADVVEDEGDVDDYPPDPPKCKDCNGKGKIALLTGIVDCETCDGSGY